MPATKGKGASEKKTAAPRRRKPAQTLPAVIEQTVEPAAPEPCQCYACKQHRLATEYEAKKAAAAKRGKPFKQHPDGSMTHQKGVRFEATPDERKLAMLMAAAGLTIEQACQQIRLMDGGLCSKAFARHFHDEWATGAMKINMAVVANLFTIATSQTHKGATTAAIFWTKTRMRWADNPLQAVELDRLNKLAEASPEDGPEEVVIELRMED